jgi:putative transcriptional regulator
MKTSHCIAALACLALAALGLPASRLQAALPGQTQPPDQSSLAGQLLVASPSIGDPRFHRSVILMVKHDGKGALGIVLNRQLGERSLASVLAALGEKDDAATGSVRIFLGGPVNPEAGFVLHSSEYRRPGTVDIDGHVAMTSDREILRDIARKQGPRKSLIAFGYAGWGPGQLEGELKQGAWFIATQDEKLIFDQDRDKVWDAAMARRTQDL